MVQCGTVKYGAVVRYSTVLYGFVQCDTVRGRTGRDVVVRRAHNLTRDALNLDGLGIF